MAFVRYNRTESLKWFRGMIERLKLVILVLSLLLAFCSCGQKGELYIPESESAAPLFYSDDIYLV